MPALRSLDREKIRPSNLQRGAESCRSLRMNRVVLRALLGIAFGVADVLMSVFGKHPERTTGMMMQTFFSGFAIGFLKKFSFFYFLPTKRSRAVNALPRPPANCK